MPQIPSSTSPFSALSPQVPHGAPNPMQAHHTAVVAIRQQQNARQAQFSARQAALTRNALLLAAQRGASVVVPPEAPSLGPDSVL